MYKQRLVLMACSTHEQWWQIIIAEFLARHQKVEDWRKAKRQQEMAECTFRPHIIPQIGGGYKKVPTPIDFACTHTY